MNNFRMLLLIPVLLFQMSGCLTNFSWNSLLLTGLSEKVCHNIKSKTFSILPESAKDYVVKKEDLKCDNNPICRKDNPLKCEIHPKIVVKKCGSISAKKDSVNNQITVKKVSVVSNVIFNGTGNAKLF